MQKQKTIATEISYTGIGLHTGNSSTVTFIPAPANSGVRFVRSDLPGKPSIQARIENVIGVIRGTTLGNETMQVHTVEHICSALFGLGIDNLTVEISANEPPVVDGSSIVFVETLLKSGLVEQDAPKNYWQGTEPVHYQLNETEINLIPGEGFSIHCQLLFDHPMIGKQEATFQITPEIYTKEIAHARTFCFDYEVEALKRKGLARGGNLSNAIVVGRNQIYNKEKLRYPNEFVRHKILDFLGDLYLLGQSIQGQVDAIKVGHGHNINFVKELQKMGERTHV